MRRPASTQRELIACHDCGGRVSFSAAQCPHCGSREPTGPYVFNSREKRLHRIEERNDRNLALATVGCTALGVFYGVMTSTGISAAVLAGCGYGLVGLILGVPIGFLINMTRHL